MKSEISKNIKKALSIILCLSIMTSLMPHVMAASITVDIYTGENIELVDRDNDTFYDISNAKELYAFAQIVNNGNNTINGELVADITDNNIVFDADGSLISDTSGLNQWIPIGTEQEQYVGMFDGANHSISGLYSTDEGLVDVGLFGYLSTDSVVRNLTISDSYFYSSNKAGAIAGSLYAGLIENCFNEGTKVEGVQYAGGIVSWLYSDGIIRKCGVNGTVIGNKSVGGVASYARGEIIGCYNVGKIGSSDEFGSIVINNDGVISSCYCKITVVDMGGYGSNIFKRNYGTVKDCYYISCDDVYLGSNYGTKTNTSDKDIESFENGEVCYLLNGDQSEIIWYQSLYTDSLPGYTGERVYNVQNCLGKSYSNRETAGEHKFYDGVCVLCEAFESAALDDGVYNIANKGQLIWFAQQYNGGKLGSSANAVLTNDIDLTGYTWTPIGTSSTKYKGVFDGQGHSVTNFNMTVTGKGDWGLFGYASGEGTVIKNFSISGDVTTALTSNVEAQYGVVGQADGTAEVRNVHSSVNLTSEDSYQKKYFGGIVGRTGNITVDMCSYKGTLSLGSNTLDCVGGVVGYVYNGKTAQITNCSFRGKIDSTYTGGNVGGILGYYNGENAKALTLSNCLSVGTLPEGRNALVGTIKNYGSTNAGSNNYYTDGMTHSVSNVTAAAATKTQLASGEIAIALGDAWGQNINNGVLNQGYPVVGGATVYCVTNCLGNADYSNTNAVRHASGCVLYNGAYSLCGEFGSNGIVDGVYHISTAEQLVSFAKTVNNGNTEIDAKLINNIDLTGYEWTPIGTAENMYGGFFDGNGKSITVQFSYSGGYEDEKENYSLFGFINSTDIQDLTVKGSIAVRGAYATGLVSQVHGNCIIRRCLTDVDITTLGIMAYASGLVGRVDGCLNIIDCGFTGSMTNPGQAFNSSGLVSDAQNTAEVFIANSFVAADFSDYTQLSFDSGDTFIKGGGIVNMIDCYYLESLNGTPAYATQKTAEQFASGEVAYLLGEAWGQMSNTEGSLPIITDNELYKVVTVGETGNYSVANVGDTNGDGTVDVTDYQAVVNKALADDHEQIETASYDDIVRYDLDGDGYLDVIDVYLLHLFINGFTTVDVYAVGDYDLNGVAFEEADIKAIKHAIENPEKLATYKKYASDINGDGKVSYDDLNTLTSMFPLYFVGEA